MVGRMYGPLATRVAVLPAVEVNDAAVAKELCEGLFLSFLPSELKYDFPGLVVVEAVEPPVDVESVFVVPSCVKELVEASNDL
jgi:hypothetical protein